MRQHAASSIHSINQSIFRTYDIRGIVDETMTKESVFLIGCAIGSLVLETGDDQVTIARDGRLSSPALSNTLSDGIRAAGCDVVNLGMVPTPILYYAVNESQKRSGVMLTGSHNPSNYNGMKVVLQGVTLSENGIQSLYQRILREHFLQGSGIYQESHIVDRYIQDVVSNIHLTRPLKVVIDAGNGVTGMVAPQLFRALGCEVHELFCEVDGHFPNHHPDPSSPENLQDLIRAVAQFKADIGLAFDGDGDRLGVVTNQGEMICPDRLLMLFARSVLQKQPKAKIIFDVKCTNHLATMIQSLGGLPLMWKTGHSLIKAKMAETGAILAGEMSGHFFFKDRWHGFDDALYAGARLLEIIAETSEDVFASIPNSVNTPELKVLVPEEKKFHLMEKLISQANFADAEMMTIDGLRVNFADGWGLVRPSNTTPYLILRFEALNENILQGIQHLFRQWMLSVEPDLVLPF